MDTLKNKKILVTGAAGFIGTNFLLSCTNIPGINIRGVYNKTPPQISHPSIEYFQGNLCDNRFCHKIVDGVDYVFMFANTISRGVSGTEHLINNIVATSQLLEAASKAGVAKLVFTSSATVYPTIDGIHVEDFNKNILPDGAYRKTAIATRAIEDIFQMYDKIDSAILRLSAVYGPYDRFDLDSSHVLSSFIIQAIAGVESFKLRGDGSQKRDFVYVNDVVEACFNAIKYNKGCQAYNIGSGIPTSVCDLLKTVIELVGLSKAEILTDHGSRDNKPAEIVIDCSKAKRNLQYQGRTPLRDGLEKTIKWYMESLKKV